jgi:putative Mg2+ transporter-C (MgtC) family protein
MVLRFAIALALGAVLGIERELVGKEGAGVRTEMLVAGGASIFTMLGLVLPYITAINAGIAIDSVQINSSIGIIANIVIGVGFLGAGVIIKMNDHPKGITTAALVWTTAAVGVLVGVGLIAFGAIAAIMIAVLLYLLRTINIAEKMNNHSAD